VQRLYLGVGGGDRLHVEGAVEQRQPLADQDVRRLLGLGCLVEPARGDAPIVEWGEGADRGGAGERQGGGTGVGVGAPRSPPSPWRLRRRSDRGQDEDALLFAGAGGANQVAPVGQRQRAGKIELRESE
jgi:hypothetical protein